MATEALPDRLRRLEWEQSSERQAELLRTGSKHYRFSCRDCGSQENIYFKPNDAEGICTTCCGKTEEGHDFEYDRDMQDWCCIHCGESAPNDYYIYHVGEG